MAMITMGILEKNGMMVHIGLLRIQNIDSHN